MKKFKHLGLKERSICAISKKGFKKPTKIQSQIIPHLLNNKGNLIGQAHTGTGKTAAFALPLIEKLKKSKNHVQVMILTPTRELANQVCSEINSLKGDRSFSAVSIYGGQPIGRQIKDLKKGASFVVGTPGRVLDHIKRKTLKIDRITHFILDEADEMLNMGFIDDVEKIMSKTSKNKNILFFSATMPKKIKSLASKVMNKKYTHIKTKNEVTLNQIEQIYFKMRAKDKFKVLTSVIDTESGFYGLTFCRTKRGVDKLTKKLKQKGYKAQSLHGDKSQNQRERIFNKFKKEHISILVATDVAARGIDVNNLTHVINYSIPQNPETYVHRIGRTGRAGNTGIAITFVTPSEHKKMQLIKRITSAKIIKKSPPDSKPYTENLKRERKNKTRKKTKKKSGETRLFIAKGKKDKLNEQELTDFLEKRTGVSSDIINNVDMCKSFSFVSVSSRKAEIILEKFKKDSQGKRSLVETAISKGKKTG